jgi:hypothetical protein
VFVLQGLGVLSLIFGAWRGIGLSEFDGPPVPESTKWVLAAVSIAAPLALLGAAVIVSGITDDTWLTPRLLVLSAAFAVNLYGIVDQTRWFAELARHFAAYQEMGFGRGDLVDAAIVISACGVGAAILARCAVRAVRFRPRAALLVEG